METALVVWWFLMVVGFVLSALYSGLETGAYSVNRVRLQVLDHQGSRAASRLRALLNRPTILLSSLLIGNNIANYMGTASMTVLLERTSMSEGRIMLLNVLLVTPILFVFGETLPKDLFSAHSDRMMYRLTWFLELSRRLFKWTGILPLVVGVGNLANHLFGGTRALSTMHPRRQMTVLVQEGVAEGLLSDEQSAMVERVLAMSDRQVGDEMVPWQQVNRLPEDTRVRQLLDTAKRTGHTRFPLVNSQGQVVGVVNVMDVLLSDASPDAPLKPFAAAAVTVERSTPVRRALRQLQAGRAHMAIVMRDSKPAGVITMKDLVEPITGELADW